MFFFSDVCSVTPISHNHAFVRNTVRVFPYPFAMKPLIPYSAMQLHF